MGKRTAKNMISAHRIDIMNHKKILEADKSHHIVASIQVHWRNITLGNQEIIVMDTTPRVIAFLQPLGQRSPLRQGRA